MRRALTALLLLLGIAARSVGAHQITGTDVATLTQLTVDHNLINGSYEVQYGELSALEERRRMDGDGDGRITEAEVAGYAARRADELAANLSLTLDDQGFAVHLEQGEVLPAEPLVAPGQMTLRYRLAPVRADLTREAVLSFRDDNRLLRLVHADIAVEAMPLVDIGGVEPRAAAMKQTKVQAPRGSVEARLTLKPSEALWQGGAFVAGQQALGSAARAPATTAASTTDRIKGMLRTERLGLGVILFALVLSLFLGAAHALEPGHGKTIVAAYLIGSRGTVANAVFLGGVVTITHTFTVILLGVLTLFASQYILPERIYPWLGASSGLLISALGIWMLARRSRGHGHGHAPGRFAHSHGPASVEAHPHPHEHGEHGHEHPHPGTHHDHDDQDHGESHPHPHPHAHDHPHGADEDRHDHHDHGEPHSSTEPHGHPHPYEQRQAHDDHHGEHDHGHPHPHRHSAAEDGEDHDHRHSHDHHDHHDHEDLHDHAQISPPAQRVAQPCGASVHPGSAPDHDRAPEGKVTLGSLLALGISGGIVPCPGALVILLLAVALHRIAFGLLLLVTFSLGLAAVLIAIGILMVKARPVFERFSGSGPVVRRLPLVSALAITFLGLAMAVRSLMEAGILIVRW